jgi:hypothetical protein
MSSYLLHAKLTPPAVSPPPNDIVSQTLTLTLNGTVQTPISVPLNATDFPFPGTVTVTDTDTGSIALTYTNGFGFASDAEVVSFTAADVLASEKPAKPAAFTVSLVPAPPAPAPVPPAPSAPPAP